MSWDVISNHVCLPQKPKRSFCLEPETKLLGMVKWCKIISFLGARSQLDEIDDNLFDLDDDDNDD